MEIPGKIRIGGQDIDVCIVERIEGEKLGQICVAEGKRMREWFDGCNIKRWAYINDLLPKGDSK